MDILKIIYIYILTIPVFALFDLLWLGFIAKHFYQSQLAHLLGPVNWYAAIVFYFIFIGGILFFAVLPALDKQSVWHALIYGAVFGFVAYATYDLTNMATLKDWPLMVTVVDIIWGAVLCAGVASVSYLLATTFIL